MKSTHTYTLTLRPMPQEDDPDGIRRLRALLKACVRSYRMQPTAIVPADAHTLPSIPALTASPAPSNQPEGPN